MLRGMSALRIFIGWGSRQAECADVLAYSLRKHTTIPLDIRYLKLAELDFDRPWDPLQSTEFTYTRFLVPHLCDFRGKAIFMDSDMLCLGDIAELDALDMSDYALRVVKHNHAPTETVKMDGRVQTRYRRKNWSSLMIMDCAALTHWTKNAVETQPGRYLHQFHDIPDARIGDIPPTWNVLDRIDEKTKLVHYTAGGPWFEQCRDHPFGATWFAYRDAYYAEHGGSGSDLSHASSRPDVR